MRKDLAQLLKIDEKNYVEEPFLEELAALGWEIIRMETDSISKGNQIPKESFRESFTDVILMPKLVEAIKRINPWIEDDQIYEATKRVSRLFASNLIEANQLIQQLLIENTSVTENRKTLEKSPVVRYIDFHNQSNNSFIAISQMKIRIIGTEHHIYPDIILFINGLPVVVIETKSPKLKDPIVEGIEQILRYSEQRDEDKEGNSSLFYYNQFVISTCRNECKFGTISSYNKKSFFSWTDPYPKTISEISSQGKTPNDQTRLIHGMLDHRNILSLIKTFTVFSQNEKGNPIKLVARYQQFRATKKIIERLLKGENRLQKGGIIWHTQGSGKSLTMMFTVREMYTNPQFRDWKIVFITDRTQLEIQLKDTSQTVGYSVKKADNIQTLKQLLKNTSSDLVMAMIHKFQEEELDELFPILNTSPKILIMVDEAHRSQYKKLAANLDRALPNATYIAYTGTPTDKTEQKYKDYIDKYTMRQAIEDGVTLEVVYEGRTYKGHISNKNAMDKKFADVFGEYTVQEQLQILGYGSRKAYLEANGTIVAKSRDIISHYVYHVFPNGFKAQIVATSREAAVRYKEAIDGALRIKIEELETKNPYLIDIERLKRLRTAVIISAGGTNDRPHLKKYTNKNQHDKDIKSFKMAYDVEDKGINGDVGIIIVNSMLLTGFDAPLEQVMYLDKVIKGHNLLQATARVNRVSNDAKGKGFIVDYVGIGHHLKEAIDNFDEKEQQEILETYETDQDLISELIISNRNMHDFIEKHKCTDLDDYDAFYDLFYDEDVRFEFIDKFRNFSSALNNAYPRKESLDFISAFKKFTEINIVASRHLRDDKMSMIGIPEKLRAIADEYLISKGINQKIPPISIIDDKFLSNVKKIKRNKTKAAAVEHAIRHYIDEKFDEDPELYASFAATVEEVLRDSKDNWDKVFHLLEELRTKIKDAENEPTYGLHRKKQMPFFRILKKELYQNLQLTEDEISSLVGLTQNLFLIIEREINLKDFWNNIPARNRLKGELISTIVIDYKDLPQIIEKRNSITSRIMEVAEKNNDIILYGK